MTWEDAFPSEPALLSIQDLTLKAENIDSAQGRRANASLAFRLNEKGNVAPSGWVGVNPPGAELKVDLKEISIQPLQPYFSDRVKIVVTDGNLSTSGTPKLRFKYLGPASPSLLRHWKGGILIDFMNRTGKRFLELS